MLVATQVKSDLIAYRADIDRQTAISKSDTIFPRTRVWSSTSHTQTGDTLMKKTRNNNNDIIRPIIIPTLKKNRRHEFTR